jgi:hypothetical protein
LLQHFDRDRTIHLEVTRSIHCAHAACTKAFFYAVLVVEYATY